MVLPPVSDEAVLKPSAEPRAPVGWSGSFPSGQVFEVTDGLVEQFGDMVVKE